jgi:tetratricopeptide (TPR) repeat protein
MGLAWVAFSALLFLKPLEDAYLLPQRLGLALGAGLLALGVAGLAVPISRLFWLGLGLFAWRAFSHIAADGAAASGPWAAQQWPQAALFVGAALAYGQRSWQRYSAAALLASAALVSLYALLGLSPWDPFASGAVDLGFSHRAHGSLGNPDFLGGWLAMLLPLSLAVALSWEGRWRRLAWLLPALMGTVLLLTQARAAWSAALAGAAVAAWMLRQHWQARRAWAWGLGLLLLAGLLAAAALSPALGARLREAVDPRSDAWTSRVFMGSVALDLALEHPISGVGPGNFQTEYLRRQGEKLNTTAGKDEPYRFTADAHNDWLQCAAETGLLGLGLWVALFGLSLRSALRRQGPEGAAVAGGLAAFGVQACFHFPWAIVPSAGLLLLGLGAATAWDKDLDLGLPSWAMQATALLCLLAVAALWRQSQASALLNSGIAAQAVPGARPLSLPLLAKAAALDPHDQRAWNRLGAVQLAQGNGEDAVQSFQQALLALPTLPEAWANLGLALGSAGALPEAEKVCQQALALNPRAPEAWANLGKVVYAQGRADEAIDVYRRGLQAAPENAVSWFNLAAILYNERRFAEAASAFEAVLRLDSGHAEAARLLKACRARVDHAHQ